MKRIVPSFSHRLLIIYRVIFIVLLLMITALLGGSLYAVLRSPDSPPLVTIGSNGNRAFSRRSPAENAASNGSNPDISVFSGIGRLRIPLAGEGTAPATMILSIAFPYPPGDRPFTEELASKISDFRSIATDYFSSLPSVSISSLDEERVKTELLRRYNAILSLGKIEALYFSDMMIIDAASQP